MTVETKKNIEPINAPNRREKKVLKTLKIAGLIGFILIGYKHLTATELSGVSPSLFELFGKTSIDDCYVECDCLPEPDLNEYTYDDFWETFDIMPLHHVLWDPKLEHQIESIDIRNDTQYAGFEIESEKSLKYCGFVNEGSQESRDRDLFYIQYSNRTSQYALFSRASIDEGTILGVYTGIVTFRGIGQDTEFMWEYPTRIGNNYFATLGKEDVGIDARNQGNYFRFISEGNEEDSNVGMDYVACNNRWFVVYYALSKIDSKEELMSNYLR